MGQQTEPEESYLRTWWARTPHHRRPHLYLHGGFWRVSAMPPRVEDQLQWRLDFRWAAAHRWAGEQNNKRKGFK